MTKRDQERVRIMAQGGIVRPRVVLESARQVKLSLHHACALLEMESGGGHNLFGQDPGGNALPSKWFGKRVTRYRYWRYKRRRNAGMTPNGVGPCQLTGTGLQQAAERLGGCWKPRHNMQVGFDFLRQEIHALGEHDGFRSYNGSGPAAERYAALALERSNTWKKRFSHV